MANSKKVTPQSASPSISELETLYADIHQILEQAREQVSRAANVAMVEAYWQIGRLIVEKEQQGQQRAAYGKNLLSNLSSRLSQDFGQGFSVTNLKYIRQFYLAFEKGHAVSDKLSWTHYRMLLKLEDEAKRQFYLDEAVACNWSTRELERQMGTHLFERSTVSQARGQILKPETQETQQVADYIKDPYLLHFLGLTDSPGLHEKDVEQAIIDHLQHFLLELGKGFAFVARQYRLTVDGEHYYVDLVFYNYLLKCFVLIDLKTRKLKPQDLGQMDFYVRYFEAEMRQTSDNPSIGLILCADKSHEMAKYTLLKDSQQIFASQYRLVLPSEEELKNYVAQERERLALEARLEQEEE